MRIREAHKHMDPTDPDPDLKHFIMHYLADEGADPAIQSAGSHLFHTCPKILSTITVHYINT
jgi:hypothetical protein